jgi:Na+-driven multidrug efflux pump
MFVGTLYPPIDLWCAARLGSVPVVAVSFAAPLFFVLMAFSVGLSQAATTLLGRQLGAGEKEEARLTWTHALVLAGFVGIVLTSLGILGVQLMLKAQGATSETLRLAHDFSALLFGGAAAFLMVATVNAAVLAEGDSKPNFWFLLGGCFANLILLSRIKPTALPWAASSLPLRGGNGPVIVEIWYDSSRMQPREWIPIRPLAKVQQTGVGVRQVIAAYG